MEVGETFIAADHLWVAVAKTPAGEVVVFNLTSFRPHCDGTCVMEAGEHPFIIHKTIVRYAAGELLDESAQAFVAKTYPSREPASPQLIAKIQRGAIASPQTPNKLKALIPRG